MFLNINNFTLVFYTAGMLFLGMVNLFQSKIAEKKSLRSWISAVQGVGYGGILIYFLVVISQNQELTPAFELWGAVLFFIIFQGEVVEATLLFTNAGKYLPKGKDRSAPSSSERFRLLKRIFGTNNPFVYYMSVVLSLVLSLGALGVHLLIITDFLFA